MNFLLDLIIILITWLGHINFLRLLIRSLFFLTFLRPWNLVNSSLSCSRLSSKFLALRASLAVVKLIFINIFERLILVNNYLTLNVVPLAAPGIVTANPLLSIEQLLSLIEVDLLAIVAILLLVVSLGAQVAQPKGFVVRVLLSGPESWGFSAVRYILFGAYDVFTSP